MLTLFMLTALWAEAPTPMARPEIVDVKALEPKLILDIKYATKDNFTKSVLYPVARCLLRTPVAKMVLEAIELSGIVKNDSQIALLEAEKTE